MNANGQFSRIKDSLQNYAKHDTSLSHELREVWITAYPQRITENLSTASVQVLDGSFFSSLGSGNIVDRMNIVPGLRMEERSPFSYRFSIRGSLLRSPYGVRNVKVYLDDFPFTDGGGNTYLSNLDISSNTTIEIIKGPDGSLFGANTGGVVRIGSVFLGDEIKDNHGKTELYTGSYGKFGQRSVFKKTLGQHILSTHINYERLDGYREHSNGSRKNIMLGDQWSYSNNVLKTLLAVTKLDYLTPGGLTYSQMMESPKQSRPASGSIPSAADQKSGISNDMWFLGLSHDWKITQLISNKTTLVSNNVDFENPFITNYESRRERSWGFRSVFSTILPFSGNSLKSSLNMGMEWQDLHSNISNYQNDGGRKGDLTAHDRIKSYQRFYFMGLHNQYKDRWVLDASISIADAGHVFESYKDSKTQFEAKVLPRFGVSYDWNGTVLRSTISKGFSAPTTAEVRPANNRIYLNLQPEYGWNYELGLRYDKTKRLHIDFSLFYYELNDAIVRHLDETGTEFFTNAGGTKQLGFENTAQYELFKSDRTKSFLRKVSLLNTTTVSFFRFSNYSIDSADFNGNRLTGVPRFVNVTGLNMAFVDNWTCSILYNHTGNIPLNDANTVYQKAYNLLNATLQRKIPINGHTNISLRLSIDNLLGQKYSSGADINAGGGRYYNPSPGRNFSFGCVFKW